MQELETPKEVVQLVVFSIAGEEYAAPILDIKEIIKFTRITKVPHAPKFVEGIINLRGKIIVVIDLLKRFHVAAELKPQHILVAAVNGNLFGVLVDQVSEVLRTEKENIKKTPAVLSTKIHANYLQGVVVLGERIIILLDIQKLLSEKEMSDLHELAESVEEPPRRKAEEHKPAPKEVEQKIREHVKKSKLLKKRRVSHAKKNSND